MYSVACLVELAHLNLKDIWISLNTLLDIPTNLFSRVKAFHTYHYPTLEMKLIKLVLSTPCEWKIVLPAYGDKKSLENEFDSW